MTGAAARAELLEVLHRARGHGFLGPGAVEDHIEHAKAFAIGLPVPSLALDLGSGGGVPGLVLSLEIWPSTRWVLLDAGARRCEFLTEAIESLGLSEQVTVVRSRAEEAGRMTDLRGTHDLVTARGFAAPAITAECSAPLLRKGGHLVVSEPPGGAPERWPDEGLALLGLARVSELSGDVTHAMATFVAVEECPDRYPRRVGIPAKRPLFSLGYGLGKQAKASNSGHGMTGVRAPSASLLTFHVEHSASVVMLSRRASAGAVSGQDLAAAVPGRRLS